MPREPCRYGDSCLRGADCPYAHQPGVAGRPPAPVAAFLAAVNLADAVHTQLTRWRGPAAADRLYAPLVRALAELVNGDPARTRRRARVADLQGSPPPAPPAGRRPRQVCRAGADCTNYACLAEHIAGPVGTTSWVCWNGVKCRAHEKGQCEYTHVGDDALLPQWTLFERLRLAGAHYGALAPALADTTSAALTELAAAI